MTTPSSFTLSAPPETDIWRKPPTTDVFSAPHTLGAPKPLSAFRSARVSVRAPWTTLYDQGGLLLLISDPSNPSSKPRWLKTGVELYQGKLWVSTVGCDAWADWSIFPVAEGEDAVTVEVVRVGDELGRSLWVYYVDGKGEKVPLREVNWVFAHLEEGLEISVGGYAARPAKAEKVDGKGLEVSFEGFEVKWA